MFSLAENCKIVKIAAPVDRNNNVLPTVWISAKQAKKITWIYECGVQHASVAAMATTLYVANDASGTKNKAITSAGAAATLTLPHYYVKATATDTLTKTAVASSTFNITTADDGKTFIIEVDTDHMGTFVASSVTYNAEYVRLSVATPTAQSCLGACQAILTGLRYQEDSPPTAMT